MAEHTLDDAAERYVERMGLLWEAEGLPRIAGRMLGYLALQPDAATLDDLARSLGVSKASVSNDARRLQRMGLVERVGRPGDRRDWYVIAPDMPARVIAGKLAEMERLHAALTAARDLPGTPAAARTRLGGFAEFQRRVIEHLTALLATLHCDGVCAPRGNTTGTP